jgi:hypothetical protein
MHISLSAKTTTTTAQIQRHIVYTPALSVIRIFYTSTTVNTILLPVGVSRIFDDENITVAQEVDFKAVSSI